MRTWSHLVKEGLEGQEDVSPTHLRIDFDLDPCNVALMISLRPISSSLSPTPETWPAFLPLLGRRTSPVGRGGWRMLGAGVLWGWDFI